MVKTVIRTQYPVSRTESSSQCPVFRGFFEILDFQRAFTANLKKVFYLFFFLNTEYWILITVFLFLSFRPDSLIGKDIGTHGTLFPIEEADPIQLIQRKLKIMDESGELKRRNRELQKKTKERIERLIPVEGITKATESRVFYYDPSYVVQKDLKDHRGKVFALKGTKINPLETVSLSHNFLFIDGDDLDQLALVKEKLKESPLKIILVKGAPLSLSEELKIPIYFDQAGILTKKLGILHVPAIVTQEFSHPIPRLDKDGSKLSGRKPERPKEKLQLRIEEIKLEEKR